MIDNIEAVLFLTVTASIAIIGVLRDRILNLRWNIEELEAIIEYKEKCIDAAKKNQVPPGPSPIFYKNGFTPYQKKENK